MSNTATNVTFGKPKIGGAIYNAPLGTTLPTDATTALGSAFAGLGYVSEEGLKNANGPSSSNIKAWGGDTVLSVESEKPDEFTFTLLEVLDVNVLKVVYGPENVSGTLSTGITVRANSVPHGASAWVVEMAMRDDAIKRIVIPNATLKELSEITYKDNEAVGYNIKLSAAPGDASFGYDTHKEYIIRAAASTTTDTTTGTTTG